MKKKRNNIITFAYFILSFLFLYPVTIILTSFFFGESKFISNAVIIISCISLGYMAGYISHNFSFLKKITVLCLTFAAILLVQNYIHNTGLGYLLYQTGSTLVFYIFGIRLFFTDTFFSTIRIGIILLLTALIISYYNKEFSYLKTAFFILTNLYMFLAVTVESQENLKNIFNQRGIQVSEIQKKFQKNNIKLIAIFFVLMILLFHIKSIVLVLLNTARSILYKIIWVIAMIIQLLYKEPQTVNEPKQNLKPPIPDLDPSKGSNFWNIVGIIVCLLLLYAAYRLIPSILRKMKETAFAVIEKLKLFFNVQSKENMKNNDECIDYVEIKKLSNPIGNKNNKPKKRNKRKLLNQIKNPAEKIRLLYAIILEELNKNMVIHESDTTGEICTKSLKAKIVSEDFKDITRLYDRVRYGEKLPQDHEVSAMEDYCFRLRKF